MPGSIKTWYYLMALSCAAASAAAANTRKKTSSTEEKIWFEGEEVPGKNSTVPNGNGGLATGTGGGGGWLGNGLPSVNSQVYQPSGSSSNIEGNQGVGYSPSSRPGIDGQNSPNNRPINLGGASRPTENSQQGNQHRPSNQGGFTGFKPAGQSNTGFQSGSDSGISNNKGFSSHSSENEQRPGSQGGTGSYPPSGSGVQGINLGNNQGGSSRYPSNNQGSSSGNLPSSQTSNGANTFNQGNNNKYPQTNQGSNVGRPSSSQAANSGYPSSSQGTNNRYPQSGQSSGSGNQPNSQNNNSGSTFISLGSNSKYPQTSQGTNIGRPSSSQGINSGHPSSSQGINNRHPESSQGSSIGRPPISQGSNSGFPLNASAITQSGTGSGQPFPPTSHGSNSGFPYGQQGGDHEGVLTSVRPDVPEDKFHGSDGGEHKKPHQGKPQVQQGSYQTSAPPIPWKHVTSLLPSEKIVAGGLVGLGLEVESSLPKGAGYRVHSPVSLAAAAAVLLLGSGGKTRREILGLFGFPQANDVDDWIDNLHHELGKVFKKYENRTVDGMELDFANGLFVDRSYPIDPKFISQGKSLYSCEIQSLDFRYQSGRAKDHINKWVTEKTRGRINDLIQENLSPETRVVITNALYFNGQWENPFMPAFTKMRPFYVSSKEIVDVPMMVHAAEVYYSLDKKRGLKVLGIPYKGKEVFFFIAIPDSDLESFVQSLNPVTLQQLIEGTSLQQVIYAVPRMKLESSWQLRKPLESKGIQAVFDPKAANLSGIAPGIFASEVYHKVQIEVTEVGTVAAAATGVTLTRDGSTPIVRADRPFVFWIYDGKTETIAFWGTVRKPEPYSEHKEETRPHIHQKNQRGGKRV